MHRQPCAAVLFGMGALAALLVLLAGSPALAIRAGITIDVHQDADLKPGQLPNDFHIEGRVCSSNGTPPVLVDHIDDVFTDPDGVFNCSINKLVPGDPSDCWYIFTADWRLSGQGLREVPYCRVIHLGLLFDVQNENVLIDLTGWWTRDGVRIGEIAGDLVNRGNVPVLGFSVTDEERFGQILRIANGVVVGPPPVSPPPMPVKIVQMDVVAFPPGPEPDIHQMCAGGAQDLWPWVPVLNGNGEPIAPDNPLQAAPDSFFDVFLEVAQPGQPAPREPVTIAPAGFLVSRTLSRFTNNMGIEEERWEWEVHGAQPAEACCLPDGSCQDLQSFECLRMGGAPQGAGTACGSWQCAELLDFGDAPDRAYQTLLAADGARHTIVEGIFLGAGIDSEADGQPNATATGDDVAGWTPDDEDGVEFVTPLRMGHGAEVKVTASVKGLLDAWVDFNGDHDWDDTGERIFNAVMIAGGANALTFAVPPSAAPGLTFARFRFSREGGLPPFGPAREGEVEDYQVLIEEPPTLDFGDAPDPAYPTLAASDGARHLVTPNLKLGQLIDAEYNGQPNADATGDDAANLRDEDGVSLPPIVPGAVINVTVEASAAGKLDAWVDYNRDGDWADRFEHVFTSQPVAPGLNVLSFTAPVLAPKPGLSFARFRLSSAGGLAPTGLAQDGEVEDCLVTIFENLSRGISIGDAKHLPVGSMALLRNKIVTADLRLVSPTLGIAIEEGNRSCGISVLPGEDLVMPPLNFANTVSVYGPTGYKGEELTMVGEEIEVTGVLISPFLPLQMTNKSTGGETFGHQAGVVDDGISAPPKMATGLNNVGSFVSTCGRITCVEGSSGAWFVWIDDGSGLRDLRLTAPNDPVNGMVVLWPSAAFTPVVGDFVNVTGILKVFSRSSVPARALVPRDASDVVSLLSPP